MKGEGKNGRYGGDNIVKFDDIVSYIIEHKVIYKTIRSIEHRITDRDCYELQSYILLWMCEHRDTIEHRQRIGNLRFYLWGMIKRQLTSTTSWYYYNIKRYNTRFSSIDDEKRL